jgi:membrane-bound ClpP family serine protease
MWRPESTSILNVITFLDGGGSIIQGCLIGVILWAASVLFGLAQGLRAQRLPVKVGTETMLGKTVNALTPINSTSGKVFVEGEYWNATSDTPVPEGQSVEITAVEGLTVRVRLVTRSTRVALPLASEATLGSEILL